MERSLIQLSPTTLVVSLPSAWVNAQHLAKGSKVLMQENDGSLIVSTQKPKTRSYTVHIPSSKGKFLWNILDSLYVAGYDEICITFDDPSISLQLERGVNYFPGYMIVSQSSKSVNLKDITQQAKEDVLLITHRLFSQILTLIDDSIQAQHDKDNMFFSSIKKRDYLINSTVSYCLRQAIKFGNMNYTFFSLLNALEQYCDSFVELCETEKTKVRKTDLTNAKEIIVQVRNLFEKKTMESYLKLVDVSQQGATHTSAQTHQLVEAGLRFMLK